MKIYRVIVLAIAMALTWFAFSGLGEAFFIIAAIASIAASMWLASITCGIDEESAPIQITRNMPVFLLKLMLEMFLSSVRVLQISLMPKPNIRPCFVEIDAINKPSCNVVFANSITLTPGTATVQLDDGNASEIIVHCLEEPSEDSFTKLREMVKGLFRL